MYLKDNRPMSTCNRLDSEALGSPLIMPKNILEEKMLSTSTDPKVCRILCSRPRMSKAFYHISKILNVNIPLVR